MPERTTPNGPLISILLTVAACAPHGVENPGHLSMANSAGAAPPVAAPDGDCGSASVHESRRNGTIDCFYNWNHGLAICSRES